MTQTHYEILGVSKEATETEIKKAYRALSLKYHPDRNSDPEATEKYKGINEAYEILSNAQTREKYNMELEFGGKVHMGGPFPGGFPGGFSGGMQMGGDINDIFNMMFAGGLSGGMPGGPGVRVFHGGFPGSGHINIESIFHHMHRPPPILKTITITLEQAYSGTVISLEIEKQVVKNNMRVHEIEIVQVDIPPGVEHNDILLLQNYGHYVSDTLCGDVKCTILIEKHGVFTKTGMDLLYTRHISLKESLCGFSFEIQHLNGKILNMNNTSNPTIVKPNFKKVVPGLGMVKNDVTGNLVIEFIVDFPEVLTKEQIAGLRDILL